jgi:hypothetical protein
MTARSVAVVVAAFAATLALLFVPGYLAKREVTDTSSQKVFDQGYKLLLGNVPGLAVDRRTKHDGALPRAGGGRSVYQCLRATIEKRPAGWVCIGLTADGRAGAAAWSAPKPNTEKAQYFVGNLESLTRPENR